MDCVSLVREFWSKFSSGEYQGTQALFYESPRIIWPTSREYYDEFDKFIEANELFGRDWNFEIHTLEKTDSGKVISIVHATSPSWDVGFFATSVFTFCDSLIEIMETYWALADKQPEWREGISKVY